jgi:hypothetical protein
MILELIDVALGTDPGAPLPPISAVARPGRPGIVGVETEQTPVVASLVAGGRMQPDSGTLTIDGVADDARIRRTVALVDTPGVAEPFPVMTLRRIVREELAFAGRRSGREAVGTVLEALDLAALADTPVQHVPTTARVRLLVELALLRDGVEGLVVTSPERHGGHVEDWFRVLLDVAERGITVLLVTSKAAARTATTMLPPPIAEATVDDGPAPSLQSVTPPASSEGDPS